MIINSIRLRNFRSFVDSGEIPLGEVNVLVGANNSGKSSVLRGLHQLQQGLRNPFADVRIGSKESLIEISLAKDAPSYRNVRWPYTFRCKIESSDRRSGTFAFHISSGDGLTQTSQFPSVEPNHLVVPFLSRRKTAAYGEGVREQEVIQISSDMANLAAKLTRLTSPSFHAHHQYVDACKAILGFVVASIPTQNGQHPGIYMPDESTIPIDQMGDGVPNIVYLLAQLAVSKNKLFLVEEPENDLHPYALKALLDLITVSAKSNQFVISTHSNIVVSHLCSIAGSKLFKVSSEKGVLPSVTTVELVPEKAGSRIQILQELGYSFSDFDLWDGWLLFEEASAERIIRDYLIPWFVPTLARVKTFSACGVTNVEPSFADLHRLMVFTHLQPAYAGRAWVRVDGDSAGKEIVEKLRLKFPNIEPDRFGFFGHSQFERYYPKEFDEEVGRVLGIADKQLRREAKRVLFQEVKTWIDADPQQGKAALAESAGAIIDDLRVIETQFLKLTNV